MPDPVFNIVDMQHQLHTDSSGEVRAEIIKKLQAYGAQIKHMLSQGLSKTDFEALSNLQIAIEQAQVVVDSYWLANRQR